MKRAHRVFIAVMMPCIAFGQVPPPDKTPEQATDEVEIPPSITESTPTGITTANDRVFVESAAASRNLRTQQSLLAPNSLVQRYARVSGDARLDRDLAEGWRGILSARADARELEPVTGMDDRFGRHYLLLREGYVSHELSPTRYGDAGRINLKNGVAVGFNPTDYFRTSSLVERETEDTSVLRENRMGTWMIRGQELWTDAALTVAYAPKLTSSTTAPYTEDPYKTSWWTERTNAQNRTFLKYTWGTQGNFIPEVSALHSSNQSSQWQYGFGATTNLGAGATAYFESNLSRSKSLVAAARDDAIEHNVYPASTPDVIPLNNERSWHKQVSTGINYVPAEKTRIIVEYQRNDAGFSYDDWRNYFNTFNRVPAARPGLIQIRLFALDQQVPLSRDQMFLRLQKDDFFIKGLMVSGLTFLDVHDRSMLIQGVVGYVVTRQLSVALQLNWTTGTANSQFETQLVRSSVLAKATYFF